MWPRRCDSMCHVRSANAIDRWIGACDTNRWPESRQSTANYGNPNRRHAMADNLWQTASQRIFNSLSFNSKNRSLKLDLLFANAQLKIKCKIAQTSPGSKPKSSLFFFFFSSFFLSASRIKSKMFSFLSFGTDARRKLFRFFYAFWISI